MKEVDLLRKIAIQEGFHCTCAEKTSYMDVDGLALNKFYITKNYLDIETAVNFGGSIGVIFDFFSGEIYRIRCLRSDDTESIIKIKSLFEIEKRNIKINNILNN